MSKPKTATEMGLGKPCWKVRVGMNGHCGHFISWTKPEPIYRDGQLVGCDMDLIGDTEHGDELLFIDWSAVTFLSCCGAAAVHSQMPGDCVSEQVAVGISPDAPAAVRHRSAVLAVIPVVSSRDEAMGLETPTTQDSIAKAIGIPRSTVSQMLTGICSDASLGVQYGKASGERAARYYRLSS